MYIYMCVCVCVCLYVHEVVNHYYTSKSMEKSIFIFGKILTVWRYMAFLLRWLFCGDIGSFAEI